MKHNCIQIFNVVALHDFKNKRKELKTGFKNTKRVNNIFVVFLSLLPAGLAFVMVGKQGGVKECSTLNECKGRIRCEFPLGDWFYQSSL